MESIIKLYLLIVYAISLIGCSTITSYATIQKYILPTKPLAPYFTLNGRFAIITHNDHYYGNFQWNYTTITEELQFSTPIGMSIAELSINSNLATLTTLSHVYSSSSVSELLEQQLGFNLPVSALHYWIRGLPDSDQAVEFTSMGFNQNNWQVEYLAWKTDSAIQQPQIIHIVGHDVDIKLFISD